MQKVLIYLIQADSLHKFKHISAFIHPHSEKHSREQWFHGFDHVLVIGLIQTKLWI